MRKTRSDSTIASLPANQREVLDNWLLDENLSYDQCVERLWQDFSVRASRSAVHRYADKLRQESLLERIQENASKAKLVETKFAENPAPYLPQIMNLVGQVAFEQLMRGEEIDPELTFNFTKLLLAGQKGLLAEKQLSLDERRVKLLEEKAAKADAAEKTLNDSELSTEEKQQRIREIFGMS